jgi:quercetin dioxygenase-like cupin family protein
VIVGGPAVPPGTGDARSAAAVINEEDAMTRRDVTVAAVAVGLSWAVFAVTQEATPPLKTTVYPWDSVKEEAKEFGARRMFFQGPTPTLKTFSVWVTTLNPGQVPHAPHRHPEPEILVVKEGQVEFTRDGVVSQLGPGSVILQVGNELHGTRNTTDKPASYYVIKAVN